MPVVVASIDVMNNIYNRGLMSSLRFCLGFLLNRTGKNVTMMQLIMGHEVSVLPKPLFQNEKKLKCRVFDLKIVATKLSGSPSLCSLALEKWNQFRGFTWPLFSISPGYYSRPKWNRKHLNVECEILGFGICINTAQGALESQKPLESRIQVILSKDATLKNGLY